MYGANNGIGLNVVFIQEDSPNAHQIIFNPEDGSANIYGP